MEQDQKRTFLAIALSAFVLFGWQAMFGTQNIQKPSDVGGVDPVQEAAPTKTAQSSPGKEAQKNQVVKGKTAPVVATEKYVTIRNGDNFLTISNNLKVREFKSKYSKTDYAENMGNTTPMQIQILNNRKAEDLFFDFSDFTGGSQLKATNSEKGVSVYLDLLENGKLNFKLTSKYPLNYRILLRSEELSEGRVIRQFLNLTDDVERIDVGDSTDATESNSQWVGIDFNYHLLSFVFNPKSLIRHKAYENGTMVADTIRPGTEFDGSVYYVEKAYDELKKMGSNLHLSVDFGYFGILGEPLLHMLQFFYQWLPNYGLAIILLTIIVRIGLFPLQIKSFKSMKKMQALQPDMQKIREKYKDDPQKLQQEVAALWKKAGANPLGGCLPMILQMPVFFAFYQVLYNATELVGAPFYFWIHDLSIKDPFYVLPVLIGVSMFFQTRLNPSAATDPMQKKVMMFMPLIFAFIMKDFPAGLNLYIFVSTVFGIVSQLVVYKTAD